VRGVAIVAGYALEESLRRRVFLIVLLLTAAFLGLFALGADKAFEEVEKQAGNPLSGVIDERILAGATLLGLAMFGTLFLGAVLAVFLTLSVVRGDAERGLLQPLVARPVGRTALLGGRFLAAGGVCFLYTAGVFAATAGITYWAGDWWPDRFWLPLVELGLAVVVVAALSLLGSIFLTATANGIAVFMLFGAGLVAGLLGQIGEAINSPTLRDVSAKASRALPFEALYQDALDAISSESFGLTADILQLGPFGGAQPAGPWLWAWVALYLAAAALVAVVAFGRKDL
jgi:ABC-type transport system involved in multi-copper enzyme maturation permease subunit